MPLYIGDYLADTARLTTEQHGAYLLLLMDYWRSGRLPDNDAILAQICKLTPDAWGKSRGILQGFFEVSNGEWVHSRVEKELNNSTHNKIEQTKKSILGNYKRWGKLDERVISDPMLKDWWENEIIPRLSLRDSPKAPSSPSPSPSPITSKSIKTIETPFGVSEIVFKDYIQLRNKLKAPVTETAIKGLQREADKAGISLEQVMTICCQNGWKGFKAEWMKKEPAKEDKMQNFWLAIEGQK